MSLKSQIADQTKQAMRARDKARLGTLRLVSAAIKQREVDERVELDDAQVLAVLDKMAKQRRESIEQFENAGRDELAAAEQAELAILSEFLPEQLDQAEIDQLVAAAIESTGASSMKDMGAVMGALKADVQGRADMKSVSATVRARLAG